VQVGRTRSWQQCVGSYSTAEQPGVDFNYSRNDLRLHVSADLLLHTVHDVCSIATRSVHATVTKASEPRGNGGARPRNVETAGAKVAPSPAIICQVYLMVDSHTSFDSIYLALE